MPDLYVAKLDDGSIRVFNYEYEEYFNDEVSLICTLDSFIKESQEEVKLYNCGGITDTKFKMICKKLEVEGEKV